MHLSNEFHDWHYNVLEHDLLVDGHIVGKGGTSRIPPGPMVTKRTLGSLRTMLDIQSAPTILTTPYMPSNDLSVP